MPDYEQAKIYKLWSPQGDEIYIGSTTQSLAVRKAHHKRHQSCRSRILFEKYDDVRIELIEEYPCKNRMELNKQEGEHIRNNDCINRCIAGRTPEEYQKENKEKRKEYYENNKEQIFEKRKEYRQNNKEKIQEQRREYDKVYREKNREKRLEYQQTDAYKEMRREYMREYRKKNKKK